MGPHFLALGMNLGCSHEDVVGRGLKAVCERRDSGLVLHTEAMLRAVPYPVGR